MVAARKPAPRSTAVAMSSEPSRFSRDGDVSAVHVSVQQSSEKAPLIVPPPPTPTLLLLPVAGDGVSNTLPDALGGGYGAIINVARVDFLRDGV